MLLGLQAQLALAARLVVQGLLGHLVLLVVSELRDQAVLLAVLDQLDRQEQMAQPVLLDQLAR